MEEPWVEITVNEQPWLQVDSLEHAGPDDAVFVLDRFTGIVTFGDGANGRRPPTGSRISASYRSGVGVAGNVITMTWTADPRLAIAAVVHAYAERIQLEVHSANPRSWRWRLALRLCALARRLLMGL
jgi:hypothetical protein